MGPYRVLSRKLVQHTVQHYHSHPKLSILAKQLDHLLPSSVFSDSLNSLSHPWRYNHRRTLILEPLSSESVKLHRLTDSNSGIVEVHLDRPEAKNAIGKEMLRGLRHAFETVDMDTFANVMIICSSVPKVFCAGADLKERKKMTVSEVNSFVISLRSTFSFLELLKEQLWVVDLKWLLHVIFGYVPGGDAKLGLPETGLAIIPGAGGTIRLPRLVGKAIAKELIFTGRKFSGRDAMSMGLVNYCVPAGEAYLKALEIAQEINQKGPLAIQMAKKAIDEGLEVDLASALEVEDECYKALLDTKDRLEGLAAFAEKRKPRYTGE